MTSYTAPPPPLINIAPPPRHDEPDFDDGETFLASGNQAPPRGVDDVGRVPSPLNADAYTGSYGSLGDIERRQSPGFGSGTDFV